MTASTNNSDPEAPRYGLRMTRADEGPQAVVRLDAAHERCRTHGRPMTMLSSPGSVHRTLDVCGLLEVLDHTTPEAMAA